jgi:diguanylate cyclase
MISNTLLLVLGGCLLGAVQLFVGVAIGMWTRRPDSAASKHGRAELHRAGAIAKRLQNLATEMSSIINEHCSELEQASQMLSVDGSQSDEPIPDAVMNVIGHIVHANQSLQSKLDQAESRLKEQAVEIEAHISRSLTDALTGLPNRRDFNVRLEERMSTWQRRREVFSLLMLDVDHFKKLNDTFGHLAGDKVLSALGTALRGAVRREDAVARYGGEEFAVLLPNTSLEQATLVAQKVREAVAKISVEHDGNTIAITVSGGLASIQAEERAETLIHRADEALYAAKRAGRNRSFVHDGTECRWAAGEQDSPIIVEAPQSDEPIAAQANLSLEETSLAAIEAANPADSQPREVISATLAETCQELRQFLAQRGPSETTAPSANLAR